MSIQDIYTAASGKSIYGGRSASVGRPAWRMSVATNTWAQIPGNKLSDIDPEKDASINPNYPNNSPWHGYEGQPAVINDWNTMAWDEVTCTMWAPLQGGHQGYAGNEPYKNVLLSNSPTWTMLRKPSGAIGMATVDLNDQTQTGTGLWSDGRPRPGHTYNNNIYVPGYGPIIFFISAPSPGAPLTASQKVFLVNETTGESTMLADLSSTVHTGGSVNGGTAYDPTRNCIWWIGPATCALFKFDMSSKTSTAVNTASNYCSNYIKLIYLPEYDMLAVFHNGGTGYRAPFFLFDLKNNNAVIEPSVSGAWSSGLSSVYGQNGVAWDGARFLLWDNASNTTEISTLVPTGDPRTQPWTKSVLTPAASNSVIPTTRCGNGTYGRFGYSKKLGGCYLLNATTQQMFFFATE